MIKVGSFVRYKAKNEIGLVGEVLEGNKARVWWHIGGTRSITPLEIIEEVEDVFITDNNKYSNGYAVESLIHRKEILDQFGPEDERLRDYID